MRAEQRGLLDLRSELTLLLLLLLLLLLFQPLPMTKRRVTRQAGKLININKLTPADTQGSPADSELLTGLNLTLTLTLNGITCAVVDMDFQILNEAHPSTTS